MVDLYLKEEVYKIIGLCMEVHNILGKGHTEVVYKDALEYEFQINSIPFEREKEYKKAIDKWHETTFIYIQKLVILFNEEPTRSQIYDYVKSQDENSPVLKLLTCDTFKLQQQTYGVVNESKEDITNPYYWICKWKDKIITECKKNKPKPYYKPSAMNTLHPLSIISKVSPMIPWWMQNNENMNLYVIQITIKKPDIDCNVYSTNIFGDKIQYLRIDEDDNPCCIPIRN